MRAPNTVTSLTTLALLLVFTFASGTACGGNPSNIAQPTATPTNIAQPTATKQPTAIRQGGPTMTIDSTKTYVATLKTEVGDIIIELNSEKTPITVKFI